MFELVFLIPVCLSSSNYAIMVDCGSSHTHVYLYTWETTEDIPVIQMPNPTEQSNFELDIRLASAENNNTVISAIGDAIIARCTPLIPFKQISSTSVFMYATAGVRLLPEPTQNSIMEKMYRYLREHSQFRVRQNMIKVISGAEEGIFGWITVNYLLKQLESGKNTSITIDMGGASTELAVELQTDNQIEHSYSIQIGRKTINIFSYSYSSYGSDTGNSAVNDYFFNIHNSSDLIPNPCYFNNYTKTYRNRTLMGTGNLIECSNAIQKVLLDNSNFTDVSIPSLDSFQKVYAISTFSYVRSFLNLSTQLQLSDIKAAFQKLENKTIDEINDIYKDSGISQKFLPGYFWQVSYILTFLEKGLNLTDVHHTYVMPTTIDGNDISWALGAMITQVYDIQIRDKSKPYLTTLLIINGVLFVGVLVVFVLYITKKSKHHPNETIPLIAL